MNATQPKLKLIGWDLGERFVSVEVNGSAHWFPVAVTDDGEDYCVRILGASYIVGATALRPVVK